MAQTKKAKAAASSAAKQDAARAANAPSKPSTVSSKQDAAMAARAKDAKAAADKTTKVVTTPKITTKPKDVQAKIDELAKLKEKIEKKVRYNDDGVDDIPDDILEEKEEKEEKEEITDSRRDAFAALTDLFASYGLESLAGEIAGYMQQGLTASEALVKLKTNPTGAYAKRFAGNFTRIKNGLNAVSEAEYINLENAYSNTLKAYGLGNMVSLNRDDNYKKFADYIAGDISADEFKDRIKTVVERVKNAEPSVKATLQSFYPEITDNDLISYFLNPKENLPKLQEKVTASEIGAAAVGAGAGLTANLASATDLARYGVDQEMARQGYSTIAGVLPTASKLGNIYGETGVKYAQAEGEAEVFKGSQDAATKRKRLASMERAAFSGSAGTNQGSLTRSTQGKI
jgi:hypothetical protein